MKKYHLWTWLFLIGLPFVGYSQPTNFKDGFEDGDFTNNPSWAGDNTLYTIISEENNHLLQLYGNDNQDPAYLSTPSTSITGSWEFFFKYNGGSTPSSSNRATIFLISNQANLDGNVNGYGVQVGESGDDYFRLFRFDNGSTSNLILTDTTTIQSNETGYRVKVTRQTGGQWQMSVAEGYGGVLPNADTTAVDNTHSTTTHFGVSTVYTSTRAENFFFDFKIDLPPLTITNTTVQEDSIWVTFNRSFDQSSIQTGDFSVDQGIGSPSAFNIYSSNVVQLIYDSPLPTDQYEVTAQNILDLQGNTIAQDATLPFVIYGIPEQGDLILNEFMYDPPAGQPEYVELQNTSDKYLNLQHWQIGDDSNSRELSADTLTIAPNHFIVVSSDTTVLSNMFGDRHYVQANLPSFNNTGDAIKLLTNNNVLADSLHYTPDWGGKMEALERRSTLVSSRYQENWGNSPASNNGTPGASNQIPQDTQPPDLRSMNILSDLKLQLLFNERLDSSTANLTHYNLAGVDIDATTFSSPDTIALALNTPLQNARQYQLTISGPEDVFGNATSSIDTSFTYYKVTAVDSGDVFINEFTFDPPTGQSEYIELYNPSAKTLNLQDWTINDGTGSEAVITHQRNLLPPDSLVVLAPDSTLRTIHPQASLISMGSRFPSLNNSGDDIVLRDSSGTLLDSLQYTDGWGGREVALERRSQTVAAIYASNWGNTPTGFGTPAQKNKIETDQMPPIVEEITIISNDSLQLTISEHPDISSAETVSNYSITGSPAIASAHFQQPDTIDISLSESLQNNTNYTFSIDGLEDLFGNTATNTDTTFTYYKVSPIDSGKVFISEFLFDPPEGKSEYIELYNPTHKSFNLNQWTLNDNTGTIRTITDERYILSPDDYVVLTADRSLATRYSNMALISLGTQFPSLNNSGDDIVLRDSSGTLLDSLRYTRSWSTSGKASERRRYDLASIYKANWGSPTDTTGSPGLPNMLKPDTRPPALATFDILNDQELQLIFDEQITAIAQHGTFVISGSAQISDQRLSTPDTVYLQLSEPLRNATKYTLSISRIQDLFGNELTKTDTLFTHYKPSETDSGQVFINEFSYNPAAGKPEYIELYNPTKHSFDLRGWTLSDNRGKGNLITNDTYILPPDSYVALSPDHSLLETTPDLPLIAMGTQFPALNNSGDDIVIRNAAGLRLDSLQYTSAWGGKEIALERRSTDVAGIFEENWGLAANKNGTPGFQNKINPDQQPPSLSAVDIINDLELQLVFSERLIPGSAIKLSNVKISPSRKIQLIAVHSDTVNLYLTDPLISDQHYTLTISGIRDIFGNKTSKKQRDLEYIEVTAAQAGDIVINEIMANPGPGSAEFVELYNRSDKNIDLKNWRFSDASDKVTLSPDILLKGGEYLILTGNAAFAQSNEHISAITGFPNLNNSADVLSLHDARGQMIDSLHYHANWPNADQPNSLERKDPKAASNDPSNWAINSTEQKISAGAQNSVYRQDTVPPGVRFAKVRANGQIEIYFTEFIQNTPKVQFTMDGNPLKKHLFNHHSGNRIILEQPAALAETIDIQHLTDIRGNSTAATNIPLARSLQKGDLVINEIMYNPLDGGDDNQADQSEYIELYNTRDYPLSLEGLLLHDAPDEDNDVRELQPVSTTAKWVKPQQTVLIYADQTVAFGKSKVASFFNLDSLQTASLLQVERSSLSLGSSDDAIFIADSTGTVIDSVFYSKEWQNPNLIDPRGRALERISPTGASNSPANWGSSVHLKGGTPHAQNSLHQEQPEHPQKMGISFAPNPFSPDGDGYEDNLVITYKLNQADYLLRVNIFDRYGRHIKEVADGKPAGFEGSLIWDGRRDDGRRNRIGIYIIIFEAINSSSGRDKAFKKTVVIARKLN